MSVGQRGTMLCHEQLSGVRSAYRVVVIVPAIQREKYHGSGVLRDGSALDFSSGIAQNSGLVGLPAKLFRHDHYNSHARSVECCHRLNVC